MIKKIIEYRIVLFFGVALSSIMALFGIYSYYKCTQNVGCLLYMLIPLLPGIFLNLEGLYSIIVSLIFWFLIGSLIGFLVYKIRKK